MMLSPQHFQQSQIYWESQIQVLRESIAPHGWGIAEIYIDLTRILQGEVWIKKLNVIMPDGLAINFDFAMEDSHHPLSLTLTDIEALNQNNKATVIHLVVPKRVPGCASDRSSIQRYESIEGAPEIDENTGEGNLIMQRLLPKLALQATTNVSTKYSSIPLFEVLQPDPGNYQLGEYCPPIINIGAQKIVSQDIRSSQHKSIQQRCIDLALSMRKKVRQLAGYVESEDERLGNRVSNIQKTWIRILSKRLPEFENLSEDRHTTPYKIYTILLGLVGEFSELDPLYIPPTQPKYDHKNILYSVNEAIKYLQTQLKIVNLRFSSLHFEEERDGIFTLHIDKAWEGKELLVELSPNGNRDPEKLAAWFNSCRIASFKKHEILAKQRLLGQEPKLIAKDEQTGLEATLGRTLFTITADKLNIQGGQPLVIVCTSGNLKDYQPRRITLHLPNNTNNPND
jgi:type VI secretion system protein ImpJ